MAPVGRDHHEVVVATIWQDLLGQPPRDLDDDFFTAGGDSLKATLFVSRLSAGVDGGIPLKDFFSAPTPRGIAGLMRGQRSPAGEGVVFMRAEGKGQQLVLLPVGAGMGFLAADVFDRPIRALEPVGVHSGPIGPADLVPLASVLVKRIQTFSGGAPLQLIGRCAGSLLALGTAAELERQGEVISAVHLLDPLSEVTVMTVAEMTAMWVQDSLERGAASGKNPPTTPEQLFEQLSEGGVDVLASSQAQFAQRVAAVVATQHAAMQYPTSPYRQIPVRCPVYAYVPMDSPIRAAVPEELYGGLDLHVVQLEVPGVEVFSDTLVRASLARQMRDVDDATIAAA